MVTPRPRLVRGIAYGLLSPVLAGLGGQAVTPGGGGTPLLTYPEIEAELALTGGDYDDLETYLFGIGQDYPYAEAGNITTDDI